MVTRLRAAKSALGLILAVGPAIGCSEHDLGTRPVPSSYAVYDAFLEDLANRTWATPLLVLPQTAAPQYDSSLARYLGEEIPNLPPEIVASARIANQTSATLGDSLSGGDRFFLITEGLASAGFDRLRAEFGEQAVLIGLSQVGFSPDAQAALIYYSFHCGPSMCAEAHHVVLRREGRGWVVSDGVLAWIS